MGYNLSYPRMLLPQPSWACTLMPVAPLDMAHSMARSRDGYKVDGTSMISLNQLNIRNCMLSLLRAVHGLLDGLASVS